MQVTELQYNTRHHNEYHRDRDLVSLKLVTVRMFILIRENGCMQDGDTYAAPGAGMDAARRENAPG